MDQNTCNTCAYYRRHYTFDQRKIFRVFCGHCTYKAPRTKKPYAKACENYMPAEADENGFVSKEYLSKALLEYMFSLDLLPEIRDMDGATEYAKKK